MDDIFSQFGDIFGGHFGGFGGFSGFGGGSRGGRRVNRGSDLRVKVKLNLKEIATGVEKKIKVKKYVTCSKCHGSGAEDDHSSKTCETCHGSGVVTRVANTILGQMQTQTTCPTCGGEGRLSPRNVASAMVKESCATRGDHDQYPGRCGGRHRAGAEKPADDQTADARMPGRRRGIRPRRADPGRLPRLQHEDGALGQRARHPHLLLHRPEGLGMARVRVKAIRRYVDRLFVIFPFECGYFPRHGVEPIFEATRS